MNIFEEIKERIEKRKKIVSEDYFTLEKYWDEMSTFLAKNINETIDFLEEECSADEFIWLSEIFEEIAKKTQSKTFIECLRKVAEKFPKECKKYNISQTIDFADGAIFVCDSQKMIKEFRILLQEKEKIDDKDFSKVKQYLNKIISILTKDIEQTNYFLDYECNFEEFYFVSKIAVDIVKKTQNKEFIEKLKKNSKKYNMESKKYKIDDFIKEAEKCIIRK